MRKSHLGAVSIALAFGWALPAAAQTAPETGAFITREPNGALRGSQLIGLDLLVLDHRRAGRIEDLVLSRDGQVAAVVVATGGLLGVGERRVALPLGEFTFNTGDVSHATTPSASRRPADDPVTTGSVSEPAAERMPGAQVSNEVYAVDSLDLAQRRAPAVRPETGPVTSGIPTPPATVPVTGGGPSRAMLRSTAADLARMPEFQAIKR